MSTPRRSSFQVSCEILRYPWPFEVKAAYLLLQAFMFDRWRSDHLEPEAAERVVLSPHQVAEITGTGQLRTSRLAIAALAASVNAADPALGAMHAQELAHGYFSIHWRNLSELQDLRSGLRPKGGPVTGRPQAPPPAVLRAPEPIPTEVVEVSAVAVPRPQQQVLLEVPRKRVRRKRAERTLEPETPPPDGCTPEQIEALEDYIRRFVPTDKGLAEYHAQQCFDHWRSKGVTRVDWMACVRTWIAKAPQMRNGAPPPVPPKPRTEEARRDQHRSAADQLRLEEEARAEREVRRNLQRAQWKR